MTVRIRLAQSSDIPHLESIEISAGKAFIGSSVGPLPSNTFDSALFAKICADKNLWIAVNDQNLPVGFLACYPLDGFLYVHEVSVSQEYQGHGIGRTLMHKIEDYAREQGYPYIGLTTFRDIRWNGPFYKSLGYREIAPDLYTGLYKKYQNEIKSGLDAAARCVMIKVVED